MIEPHRTAANVEPWANDPMRLMVLRAGSVKPGILLPRRYEMDSTAINHPPHYTFSEIEPIDVIEAWKLGFHLGNVIKYVSRAAHKGDEIEDLKKAQWYLDRYILLAEMKQLRDAK